MYKELYPIGIFSQKYNLKFRFPSKVKTSWNHMWTLPFWGAFCIENVLFLERSFKAILGSIILHSISRHFCILPLLLLFLLLPSKYYNIPKLTFIYINICIQYRLWSACEKIYVFFFFLTLGDLTQYYTF